MKIREQHICGMQQKQGLEGNLLWSLKRNKKHSLKNKPPTTYTLSKDNISIKPTWGKLEACMLSTEEGMATHSSILAWRIPQTEEPGGLSSLGLQRVRREWSDLLSYLPQSGQL